MTFEQYMDRKYLDWKLKLTIGEIQVYKYMYDEIMNFKNHHDKLVSSSAPDMMVNGTSLSIQHLECVLERDIEESIGRSHSNVSRETYIARSI